MKGITWLELGEPSKDDIKCTMRLTTEMGECRGWENSTRHAHPSKDDIKCTLLADHRNGGMWRYWAGFITTKMTTEMGECGGCESFTEMSKQQG